MEEKEPYFEFTPEMETLDHLIRGIPVAILTTLTEENKLRSYPLLTQDTEFDGTLWFLIKKKSALVQNLQNHSDINLTYTGGDKCVSISGTAEFADNQDMVREIWQKHHEVWFPEGPQDPTIQLLKVKVHTAEYWEDHTSPAYRLIDFVRTTMGNPSQIRTHGSLDLRH